MSQRYYPLTIAFGCLPIPSSVVQTRRCRLNGKVRSVSDGRRTLQGMAENQLCTATATTSQIADGKVAERCRLLA